MSVRSWITFAAMACTWGALSRLSEHYAGVALRSYRQARADRWFEQHIRPFLQ